MNANDLLLLKYLAALALKQESVSANVILFAESDEKLQKKNKDVWKALIWRRLGMLCKLLSLGTLSLI